MVSEINNLLIFGVLRSTRERERERERTGINFSSSNYPERSESAKRRGSDLAKAITIAKLTILEVMEKNERIETSNVQE